MVKDPQTQKLLLSQLLLNGTVDADSARIINHQTISFGEVLQLAFPVVVEGSVREALHVERRLELKSFSKLLRDSTSSSYILHQHCAGRMEARKLLQRQHTLLERQAGLLELDVIASIGDFLEHEAVGGNVEHRNDTESD